MHIAQPSEPTTLNGAAPGLQLQVVNGHGARGVVVNTSLEGYDDDVLGRRAGLLVVVVVVVLGVGRVGSAVFGRQLQNVHPSSLM